MNGPGLSSAAQPGPARPASLREPTLSDLTYKPLIRLVFLCNNAQAVKTQQPVSHRHSVSKLSPLSVGARTLSRCTCPSPLTVIPFLPSHRNLLACTPFPPVTLFRL
ncbi:hypothetical protein FVEG_14761 [Fusarium verticillioides 7600]|uniref:Uncharacterized protein n=1 Tax=Gibberella moniliformis (strain M3125 / FGSC 7600) TaxID=334819 RepID=W7LXR7_GIBM7|nr:hypothetical protein FVEG_14761 [Fusarium verticillioides 7600]XP_018743541.1 hypothetical protein FVEG_14761 [Fusarium verticillioides 7600]XP_018743542.1 hypothetical protein FVEG_14761 [Fusarium verticillioides 7600]XP_018743543.1 hypothetical protein FVEG_14761 [Fusarium verticillioides 7600]XP_018743544.1 hypothetical protein FVEG_14761 [Fusarium verticillioides 7600]XP_018743545.1 hypothetical protein FVEG_14761 [Fusarium verticillioides 7600]XP_018743546.1 hypothetical protein FVEG_